MVPVRHTMTTEIFTTPKRITRSFHPATGWTSMEEYDVYTLVFVAGNWHLGRFTYNGYARYNVCQFGATETRKKCAEFGVPLPN